MSWLSYVPQADVFYYGVLTILEKFLKYLLIDRGYLDKLIPL